MSEYTVSVGNLPDWLDCARLLGPGEWLFEPTAGSDASITATASLSQPAAADLVARVRGTTLAGRVLTVTCAPALSRASLREARKHDLERRRDTTPGFRRPGTRVDTEGRYSLTPEDLALELGRLARGRAVVDLGCGVGGNAIGFARSGSRVLAAIERNTTRVRLARHNAAVYGVDDRIEFISGDARAVVLERDLRAPLLFVDPPWGRDWATELPGLRDMPLLQDAIELRGRFDELWIKLPPSFDPRELPDAGLTAIFGASRGDRQYVKFLLARLPGRAR